MITKKDGVEKYSAGRFPEATKIRVLRHQNESAASLWSNDYAGRSFESFNVFSGTVASHQRIFRIVNHRVGVRVAGRLKKAGMVSEDRQRFFRKPKHQRVGWVDSSLENSTAYKLKCSLVGR